MPSRRVRRSHLPLAGGARPGWLAGAGPARPRAGGLGSGSLPSRQRPAVLGRGEEDARGDSRSEEGGERGGASASRLKATITVSQVVEYYGGRADFSGNWKAVRCPFHGDTHASASYNDIIGQFFCHACDVHGDIFDLVGGQEGLDFPGQVAFIAKEFG